MHKIKHWKIFFRTTRRNGQIQNAKKSRVTMHPRQFWEALGKEGRFYAGPQRIPDVGQISRIKLITENNCTDTENIAFLKNCKYLGVTQCTQGRLYRGESKGPQVAVLCALLDFILKQVGPVKDVNQMSVMIRFWFEVSHAQVAWAWCPRLDWWWTISVCGLRSGGRWLSDSKPENHCQST